MPTSRAGLGQRLLDHPRTRWALGTFVLGGYLRLVRATSRVVFDLPDRWENADWPVIGVSWHGQSNLAYIGTPKVGKFAILVSRHPDGQMAAANARSFGYGTIDGSGASDRQRHGTGGVGAFRAMLRALESGQSLFLTADIPPVPGRQVSPGVIALARRSGRPVYAMATASSRRRVLEHVWDKMQINYPFSRIGYAACGPLIMDDPDRPDEDYAAELKLLLDEALRRALAAADGTQDKAR